MAARTRREAERAKVTSEMAALEAKRRELEGLLATPMQIEAMLCSSLESAVTLTSTCIIC